MALNYRLREDLNQSVETIDINGLTLCNAGDNTLMCRQSLHF